MKLAYDNGVNFFDNAEIYSRGESEKVMVFRRGWGDEHVVHVIVIEYEWRRLFVQSLVI